VRHERRPGVGSLAGWRGADGDAVVVGAPNPRQLEAYVANECFWSLHLPAEQRYFKHANKAYLEGAAAMGFLDKPEPIVLQLYAEPLQKFRLAAQGHGAIQPPAAERARIDQYFDPLPIWYVPFEEDAVDGTLFPLHAVSQRPMPMYHSWGSQNAWLRQIYTENALYVPFGVADALNLADGEWVWAVSAHGRVKCRIRRVAGVNRDTVWTWNAMGKRAGAWNLPADAPEAQRAFLLNDVIGELLPAGAGTPRANSDPVTGQAAWYDLRVRLERAPAEVADATSAAQPLARPAGLGAPPLRLRRGADLVKKPS
jgi:anaerobic selenocysteine-containing dehydrogenase